MRDDDVSTLVRNLGTYSITSTGVGVLLDTSCRITESELKEKPIGNKRASLLVRALE
jgi:hypothetical protein